MMLTPAMTETVTVHRRPVVGRDARGNDVRDDITEDVTGVSVQPDSAEEDTDTGEQYTQRWRLFAHATLTLDALEAVTKPGVGRLEVDGPPMTWPGPDGRPHHVETKLVRRTG